MTRKIRFFVDFDREERWLNEMAHDGQVMRKTGLLYSSTPIAPGTAVVRIDYRPSMSVADFEDYRSLFADAGWRHLSGSRRSGAQHFVSTNAGAGADAHIFSDTGSRAQRYRRARDVNTALALPFLTFVFVLVVSPGKSGLAALLSPSEWYLTPGIWQRHGAEFLGAFLVETPFVLFRVGAPLLLVVACVAFLVLAVVHGVLFRRAIGASRAA